MLASNYSDIGSHIETVKLLIPVSNYDLRNKDGMTALMLNLTLEKIKLFIDNISEKERKFISESKFADDFIL